jgi:hypothetical protein
MNDKEKQRVVIENEDKELGMKLCFIEQSRIFFFIIDQLIEAQ